MRHTKSIFRTVVSDNLRFNVRVAKGWLKRRRLYRFNRNFNTCHELFYEAFPDVLFILISSLQVLYVD